MLDLDRGLLAYQAAKSSGVLSALQALLNRTGHGEWVVQRLLRSQTWEGWQRQVQHVTRLTFWVQRPNPNYVDRERIQQLLEGTRAEMAKIVLTAEDDGAEGLNLEDAFVQQLLDHTEGRGYGRVQADGEARSASGDVVERRYDSLAKGADEVRELPASDSGVISPLAMSDALATVEDDVHVEAAQDDDEA